MGRFLLELACRAAEPQACAELASMPPLPSQSASAAAPTVPTPSR